MQETRKQPFSEDSDEGEKKIFIVVCASGFDNIERARSALMFAGLAVSANYRTVLYCIQKAVDIMVRGAVEKNEIPQTGVPSLSIRLEEALNLGVEIQCCTQTMANKNLKQEDLIPGVKAAGAMNLISLASSASGTLCF